MCPEDTIEQLRRLMRLAQAAAACRAELLNHPRPSPADLQRLAIHGLLSQGDWNRASQAIARLHRMERASDRAIFSAITGRTVRRRPE